MQKKQRATIQNIADIVGVSKTTVSRYLNNKLKYMSAETKSKIEEAIKQTDFRPNRLANSLKTSKSGLIGLVLSDVTAALAPYIIGSVCTACIKYEKKVIVINSNGDLNNEINLVKDLLDQQVEGILVGSGYNHEFYYTLSREECPIVIMSRINLIENANYGIDSIYINHWESTSSVITHLADKGFEKILLVTTPYRDAYSTFSTREKAAISTCKKIFGSENHCEKVIIDQPWLRAFSQRTDLNAYSYDSLSSMLLCHYEKSKKEKTALFVIATSLMGDLICCCYQHNISFDDHFTVAGYDSYQFSRFANDKICVIEQPLMEMGQLATERLMQQIEVGGTLPIQQTVLRCKLTLQ